MVVENIFRLLAFSLANHSPSDWQEWSQNILPSTGHLPSLKPKAKKSSLPPLPEDSEVSFNLSNLAPTVASVTPKKPAKVEVARIRHAGFYNKGNTCYANSILQALSVVPSLWSQSPSESPCPSPLVKSVAHNMSLLQRSISPVDPSSFLRALQCRISTSIDASFNFNTQQDVPDILRILLDEFKGSSIIAQDIVATTVQTTVMCDVCFCSSTKEDKLDILTLPTRKHISNSIHQLLQIQPLSGDNMWFCPYCNSKQNATTQSSITNSGSILILQLMRYDNCLGNVYKNNKRVLCLPTSNHQLKLPINLANEVSFSKEYSLVATINHSGNLNAGHYWAFVKDSDAWLECNDSSVLKVKSSALNNTSCYVLFYVQC